MNKTLELIWKTLINPKEAFDTIREEKPVYAALIYLLLFGLVSVVSGHFASQSLNLSSSMKDVPQNILPFFNNFQNAIKSIASSPMYFVIGMIAPYVSNFISVSIYELLAQFTIKKSNGLALFTAWAFASIPMLIYKLLDLLFSVSMNYVLPGWVSSLFLIWEIVLLIIAIKEVYQTDAGTATGIYFTPIVAIIVLVVLYILFLLPAVSNLLKLMPNGVLKP